MVSTNKNYFLLFTNTAQFIQEPLTLRLNIFSTAEVMCMCNSSLCCWWSFWMVVLVVLLFHHHYFKWIFSCQLIRFFLLLKENAFWMIIITASTRWFEWVRKQFQKAPPTLFCLYLSRFIFAVFFLFTILLHIHKLILISLNND